MNRRLNDQVLILEAVSSVRKEFRASVERGDSFLDTGPILIRLVTLYSLLDVEQIKEAVDAMDRRNERKAA